MGVSSEELNKLRCEYQSILSQFYSSLEKSINDSEGAKRDIVFSSGNTIAMIGYGDQGDYSEIIDDKFHKSVTQIEGSFNIDYADGAKETVDSINRHIEIPPMRNYKATANKDNTVSLIVLRKILPLVMFLIFTSCAATYSSTTSVTVKKQPTQTEGEE